jgi:hypothetical protein
VEKFKFRLQRVLDFRVTQLELEEQKFRLETEALAEVDRLAEALKAEAAEAERRVLLADAITGTDLQALGYFRIEFRKRETALQARRAERMRSLAARQAAMMEARRRCKLLERLKERRFQEWRTAAESELESLASESFLAQWARRPRADEPI